MAFENVRVHLSNGTQYGPIDWNTLTSWVREQRLAPDSMIVDQATGQQCNLMQLTGMMQQSWGGQPAAYMGNDPNAGLSTLIPYKNKPALIGYYLSVFGLCALIPIIGVVGIIMSIAAIALGFKGKALAKENPQVKGTAHALVAIILGFFDLFLGMVINMGFFWMMFQR